MSELLYKTLRESVVNAIRAKIMNHQIRPGERIVELELAQEFIQAEVRSVKHCVSWRLRGL